MTSGVLVYGDVRDALIEGSRGNWAGVAWAVGGLVPGFGDAAKGAKAMDDLVSARRVVVDLAQHDDWGGHGLLKHVGLTDEQLHRRLADEPKIPAASTFVDAESASEAATTVVEQNKRGIDAWLSGGRWQLPISYRFDHAVGRVVPRGEQLQGAHDVTLLIRRSGEAPGGWYIHTMLLDP